LGYGKSSLQLLKAVPKKALQKQTGAGSPV